MYIRMHVADRGPQRPAGYSPLRRGGVDRRAEPVEEEDEDEGGGVRDIERNLQGLTHGIPAMRMDDVPYPLQRHTVGVPGRISRLLRKVVRAVMCYHQRREESDEGRDRSPRSP
jgi:hypothetical protein